jgi:peptidylprolyl isomerase
MTTLTRASILPLLLTGFVSVTAQTAAPAHHTATTTTAHKPAATAPGGCATNVPVLSPKIPALPAGSPCAKVLYTITTIPTAKLESVSPAEGTGLNEYFGLVQSSFSLLYIDTKIGAGPLALPHKWYTINYTGYLLDGTQFDTSVGKDPISINYGQRMVIPGWDTGFGGMHIGGKRRLIIPFQLAYGPNAHGPIPARSPLVFDVELISQSDEDPRTKTPPTPKLAPATPPTTTPSTPPTAAPAPTSKPATPPPTQSTTPDAKPATPQQ